MGARQSRAASCSTARPAPGKTMLAKAVAAEAGVPFLYASGSEFVEKYVGVGARRIRDLFAQARKLGRAVDLLRRVRCHGKARGGPNSHEEREQTLNQLLVELDGFSDQRRHRRHRGDEPARHPRFGASSGPGRFTRKIHVPLPDVQGRREILDVHAKDKPLAADGRPRGPRAQDLRLLGRDARRPAQRGGDPRRAPRRATSSRPRPAQRLAEGGASARRAGARWTSASASIIAAHEVGHAICGRIHGDRRTGRGDQPVRPRRGARRDGLSPRRTTTCRPSPTCARASSR